jgi:hypothetical protein
MDNGGVLNGGSNSITRTFSVNITTAPPPQLRIQLAGGKPVVSWPDTGASWLLQGATGVTGVPAWRGVPVTPVLAAGRYWVTNTSGGTMQYFRLCGGCGTVYSPPDLSIRLLSASDFSVSWSAAFGDFVLESRTDATSGAWTGVTTLPVVIAGTNQVILNRSDASGFYRLRGP